MATFECLFPESTGKLRSMLKWKQFLFLDLKFKDQSDYTKGKHWTEIPLKNSVGDSFEFTFINIYSHLLIPAVP